METTTTAPQQLEAPARFRIGTRVYTADSDGWCAALDCWVAYGDDGRIFTIPND